jgi:L-2-hydroxycarboxylate dehydrogenase (NAD+)
VALIDGHRGLGQPAAVLASKVAARKAKQFGTAVVGVTNSTDIFMIGYYADLIAAEGLAALVFTSGPPLVHPTAASSGC